MARNLVACSDPCGRVWIEDAEHGRFPPDGFYLSFPQQLTKSGKPHKGNTAEMLAFARKMAAADELLEALELAEQTLGTSHWGDIAKARNKARAAIAKAEEVE